METDHRMSRRGVLANGAALMALATSTHESVALGGETAVLLWRLIGFLEKNLDEIIGWIKELNDQQDDLCKISWETIHDFDASIFNLAIRASSLGGLPYSAMGDGGLLYALGEYSKEPTKKNYLALRNAESSFIMAANLYIGSLLASEKIIQYLSEKENNRVLEKLKAELGSTRWLLSIIGRSEMNINRDHVIRTTTLLAQLVPQIFSAQQLTSSLSQKKSKIECK